MKKILFLILMLVVQIVQAQDAVKILDNASKNFKKAGDVKIAFTATTKHGSTDGTISISGKRFYCNTGGARVWFDGTTMWHYTESSEEVNITNPTPSELARMNPYTFITLYKNGYKCKMGASTASYYEVEMISTKKTAYKSITVHLDKKSYQPLFIKTITSSATTEIAVKSYKPNQKFAAGVFTFNKKEFPHCEVVDLR